MVTDHALRKIRVLPGIISARHPMNGVQIDCDCAQAFSQPFGQLTLA